MAASTWRMNGLWRRTARVLVLCALLLSNEVMCQDATDAPVTDAAVDADPVTDAADSPAAPDVTAAPDVGSAPTGAVADEAADEAAVSAASAASGHISFPATVLSILNPENQDGGASWATVAPIAGEMTDVPVDSNVVQPVVPDVKCVGEKKIQESNALKVEVGTADCEETKRMIQENPAPWCPKEKCNLEIFQDGRVLSMTSNDAKLSTLAEVLQSGHLKDKLGVANVQTPPSSSSSVFVGILVTGLLAALAIIVGYFKCQRRSETKGVRLAEEAYPVDQENQGNTLVSVAPLNPPPETQEKPSVNGESPEAAKTEPPPPTNGHSATKTADTEL